MNAADFDGRLDKSGECWIWTGRHNDHGYGLVHRDGDPKGKTVYAHRHAYALTFGPIPPGGCILHSCDVRDCVRPDHLRLGTRAENSADMVTRGRSLSGERHPMCRVSDVQVEAIRVLRDHGWTQSRIAQAFPVSRSGVSLILAGARRGAP